MSDFTDSDKIHACLGDYWYSIYMNNEQIGNYVASICFTREQWDYQFKDTKDCLSRHEVPIYETVKVKPIYVLKSDFLTASKIYATHDGSYTYNGQISFDVPVLDSYRIPIDSEIKHVGSISPKLLDGTKYVVEVVNNYISVPFNLFNSDFKVDPVYDEKGNVKDYKATVWLFDISVDKEDIYYQYGYIFNIKLNSSESYKNLINVLYDSLINGPSENTLRLYISAITGIPVILEDTETILEINCDDIITDKHTYSVGKGDKITVSVGDTLKRGDTLTSGLSFYKPAEIDDTIKALSLGRNYISTCAKDIVFENKDYTTTITTESGYSRLDLPILGMSSDVSIFNDTVFANGIAKNTRVDATTEEKVLKSLLK